MKTYFRHLKGEGQRVLIILISVAILSVIFPILREKLGVKADIEDPILNIPELAFSQGNSLISLANPTNPEPEVAWKLNVMVTAYSSTTWETDETPYITASGNRVKDGIVANNILPFGTKIRIPELYGDKIFVVEDRMSWKKSNYHVDIWLPCYPDALNFGAKRTYIEVLES